MSNTIKSNSAVLLESPKGYGLIRNNTKGQNITFENAITIYGKKKYCEPKNIPHELNLISIRTLKGKHLNAFSFGLFSTLHAIYFHLYSSD